MKNNCNNLSTDIFNFNFSIDSFNEKLKNFPFCSTHESSLFGINNPTLAPTDSFTALESPFRIKKEEVRQQSMRMSECIEEETEEESGDGSDGSSLVNGQYELQIDLTVGQQHIADGILRLQQNKKYGLVGRNGVGKSSLLRALNCGEFGLKRSETVMVRQEFNSRKRVVDFCGEEAGKAMKLFGFTTEMQSQPINSLSGGWRMRAQLARAVNRNPAVLMLDEPTNFLDLKTIKLLQKEVMRMQTVIVVSHDRNFLNAVCDFVIHLKDEKLTVYRGNYDAFIKTKQERDALLISLYEKQQAEISHAQNFINRFRANAKRASQAQSRAKALEKMERIEMPTKEPEVKFSFIGEKARTNTLLEFNNFSFTYDGRKKILNEISFRVENKSRMIIVGENGEGKSTLLKEIYSKCNNSSELSAAYFAQHSIDILDLNITPLQFLMQKYEEEQSRIRMSNFGLNSSSPIRSLSGGQKSRLVFSSFDCANLLLLDEPTNHLDLRTIEALSQAIRTFDGAVVCVSHDLAFIKECFDEVWVCERGKLEKYRGGIEKFISEMT
ncbi:hypothetical protein NUSPORA_02327 [Nucleospora cyclopteri]